MSNKLINFEKDSIVPNNSLPDYIERLRKTNFIHNYCDSTLSNCKTIDDYISIYVEAKSSNRYSEELQEYINHCVTKEFENEIKKSNEYNKVRKDFLPTMISGAVIILICYHFSTRFHFL